MACNFTTHCDGVRKCNTIKYQDSKLLKCRYQICNVYRLAAIIRD